MAKIATLDKEVGSFAASFRTKGESEPSQATKNSYKCPFCHQGFQNLRRICPHLIDNHPDELLAFYNQGRRLFGWDGGKYGFAWRLIRIIALRKANYKCLKCGNCAELVHHNAPVGKLSYDGLIPLCLHCHGPFSYPLLVEGS